MRFSTKQHSYYCGIDLHARTLYVCLLDQAGEIVFHRNMSTRPASFLKTIAPYREGSAVAVECIFPWSWLADLCAQEKVPFILGHALSMKALPGGKAKTDKIDAHQIAVLLRGGMLPMADGYPAELRSTRDLLRRRMPLRHKRSELLVHLQTTTSQDCLPEFGKKLADKNTREGVAEHVPDPRVRKSMEMALSLIDHYDELLPDVARYSTKAAKIPDAEAFHRLRSVPGIGKSLALVILYEIHAFHRFPTRPGLRFLCPAGAMRQGVCRQAARLLWRQARHRSSQVGLLGSLGPLFATDPPGATFPGQIALQARQGQGIIGPGPETGPGGLFPAEQRESF